MRLGLGLWCALWGGGILFPNTLHHLATRSTGGGLHHVAAGWFADSAPDGLPSHCNGFGFFVGFGFKACNHLNGNGLFGEAFNFTHETFFIQAHQIHRCTIVARASGTANAVDVIFADIRNFVVHHMRQIVDVDTACGNIGSNQGADFTRFEATQCLRAGGLALVAMQCHRADALLGQKFCHRVCAKFGTCKYQNLTPLVFVDDVGEQGFFLAASYRMNHLRNALHGGIAGRDLHGLRVFEQTGSEFPNFIAKGGREQQTLLILWHGSEDFFYVMDKAHVQHAVGFVEDENLHMV